MNERDIAEIKCKIGKILARLHTVEQWQLEYDFRHGRG